MGSRPTKQVVQGGFKHITSVALANKLREEQGPWETEVSYGGEADLHTHYKNCTKNPGHLNFIPVRQFSQHHLPPSYQDDGIVVDYVKAVSDLTVRVSVRYVSRNRPKTFPGNDLPYPCYNSRGKHMMRVGTGLVNGARIFPHKWSDIYTCDCVECRDSASPRREFAYIEIFTATHVVFDEPEAEQTTCFLFFDGGSTPKDCAEAVELKCGFIIDRNVHRDRCRMRFVTHDIALARRLARLRGHARELSFPVRSLFAERQKGPDAPRLNVIVSHPHGCSKQVSVGYCVGNYLNEGLAYTTATCPGSSGAHMIGESFVRPWFGGGLHSGNCDHDGKLNFTSHKWGLHINLFSSQEEDIFVV